MKKFLCITVLWTVFCFYGLAQSRQGSPNYYTIDKYGGYSLYVSTRALNSFYKILKNEDDGYWYFIAKLPAPEMTHIRVGYNGPNKELLIYKLVSPFKGSEVIIYRVEFFKPRSFTSNGVLQLWYKDGSYDVFQYRGFSSN